MPVVEQVNANTWAMTKCRVFAAGSRDNLWLSWGRVLLSLLERGVTASPFIQTVREPSGSPEDGYMFSLLHMGYLYSKARWHLQCFQKHSDILAITVVIFFLKGGASLHPKVGRWCTLMIKHVGSKEPTPRFLAVGLFCKLMKLFEF